MFEFDEATIKELETPLTAHELEGKGYKYAKISEVIDKLNKVFNYSWSNKIIKLERVDDYIIAVVEISVDGMFKQGVGGDKIKVFTQGIRKGEVVDLTNNYASAIASAIKNAAKQFGIKIGENEKEQTYTPTKERQVSSIPTKPVSKPQKKIGMDLIEQTANNVASALRNNKTAQKQAFPSAVDQEKTTISSAQLRAVKTMSSNLKLSPPNVIRKAFQDSDKQSFEELTMSEAATIIQTLNRLRQESSS